MQNQQQQQAQQNAQQALSSDQILDAFRNVVDNGYIQKITEITKKGGDVTFNPIQCFELAHALLVTAGGMDLRDFGIILTNIARRSFYGNDLLAMVVQRANNADVTLGQKLYNLQNAQAALNGFYIANAQNDPIQRTILIQRQKVTKGCLRLAAVYFYYAHVVTAVGTQIATSVGFNMVQGIEYSPIGNDEFNWYLKNVTEMLNERNVRFKNLGKPTTDVGVTIRKMRSVQIAVRRTNWDANVQLGARINATIGENMRILNGNDNAIGFNAVQQAQQPAQVAQQVQQPVLNQPNELNLNALQGQVLQQQPPQGQQIVQQGQRRVLPQLPPRGNV